MLHPKKNWTFVPNPDPKEVEMLAEQLKTTKNPYFLQLLVSRGIKNFEDAKAFMLPDLSQLHDPFLMKDMDKAVERLSRALEDGEKILVYGDYDVDGTTSVAVMYSYLTEMLGADCDYYIPDRYSEGYGVSQAGVQYALDNEYSLIISLDCGVKAHEKIAWCNDHGIDFIVCDHHLPEANLPEAYAVLDPKRIDCPYPFKELTGCGVGFKLICALAQTHDLDMEPIWEKLDLLACSIAADMVPIVGENRILAFHGLKKLGKNPTPGLGYLLQKAGKKSPIQITDVVFSISPIINAAGRMEHAHGAVKLLLSSDYEEARIMAEAVIQQNLERKAVEKEIVGQALAMFETNDFLKRAKSSVLFYPEWHKGVVGIVASKIQEQYYRPTIILTESNGQVVGSARSVKGFDIHHALEQCVELLEQFGGHTHAAGLHLKHENLAAFINKFESLVVEGLGNAVNKAELRVDLELPLSALTLSFHDNLLVRLSPYGPGNMLPYFVSSQVFVRDRPQIMKDEHLKIQVSDTPNGATQEAVCFGMRKDFYEGLMLAYEQYKPIQILFHVDINEFRGSRTLQLRVLDFKDAL
ncbi:single-stranded-DNA-specific exonuclease RecJ [Aquirufa sp. ROCK2-A2]